MPKYKPRSSNREYKTILPDRTILYLEKGAPEGSRNDELLHAAAQFRDAGYGEEQAIETLVARGIADGLPESECVGTIQSAYGRPPRRPVIQGGATLTPYRTLGSYQPKEDPGLKVDPVEDVPPVEIPPPIENGLSEFLNACFKQEENISIGKGGILSDGRKLIDAGETDTIEGWIEHFEISESLELFNDGKGAFIRVNPMTPGGKSDAHVKSYRHCLIEFDSVPKDQQYGVILASRLPISAILDSGGKSIHAWVRVDAKNRKEYDLRAAMVYSVFSNYDPDPKNKNPSRYSRLPGATRPEGNQKLLKLKTGANSWHEWEMEHEDDGLGDIVRLEDFMGSIIQEPRILIDGILHKGGKMVVGGPSKARKTWVVMDLALCVANGLLWMGKMQCNKGSVLYINFELMPHTVQKRTEWISDNKLGATYKGIDLWNLRGKSADLAQIVDKIIRRLEEKKYDLIIIDPIYKCLGNRDENKAGDMTDLLNHLERLSETTGAAVAIAAHFPKGNMGGRESMDRIAGSGVFARDPDAIITMSPHENESKSDETVRFVVEMNLRSFPEQKPFVVLWSVPLMTLDTVKPRLQGSGGRPKKGDVKNDLVPHLPATMDELISKTGLSKRTVANRIKQGRDDGLIQADLLDGKYCTDANAITLK